MEYVSVVQIRLFLSHLKMKKHAPRIQSGYQGNTNIH